MKAINTKFGTIYIEDLEYDHHNPAGREEEDRIKILDSLERYMDYVSLDTLVDHAYVDGITQEESYNRLCKFYENAEHLNDIFPDNIMFATKSWKEMYVYMLANDYFDDDMKQKISRAVWAEDLTDDYLISNELVNVVGDYYVLVSEY